MGFTPSGGVELHTIFRKAATAVDPSAEIPRSSSLNFRRKEGAIRALLVESGLREVEETALSIQMNFDSFDDLWLQGLRGGGPTASYIVKLSPEHKQAVYNKLRQDVLKERSDGPFTLQARAWAARGNVAGH